MCMNSQLPQDIGTAPAHGAMEAPTPRLPQCYWAWIPTFWGPQSCQKARGGGQDTGSPAPFLGSLKRLSDQ